MKNKNEKIRKAALKGMTDGGKVVLAVAYEAGLRNEDVDFDTYFKNFKATEPGINPFTEKLVDNLKERVIKRYEQGKADARKGGIY